MDELKAIKKKCIRNIVISCASLALLTTSNWFLILKNMNSINVIQVLIISINFFTSLINVSQITSLQSYVKQIKQIERGH